MFLEKISHKTGSRKRLLKKKKSKSSGTIFRKTNKQKKTSNGFTQQVLSSVSRNTLSSALNSSRE